MARVVEAIYENGTLKPLETLDLPEQLGAAVDR